MLFLELGFVGFEKIFKDFRCNDIAKISLQILQVITSKIRNYLGLHGLHGLTPIYKGFSFEMRVKFLLLVSKLVKICVIGG